jgi:hypothetical protein
MVVEHHSTLLGVLGRDKDGLVVPPGHGSGSLDDPLFVHDGQEADLAAAGSLDLLTDRERRLARQSERFGGPRATSGNRVRLKAVESSERLFREPDREAFGYRGQELP